MPNNRSDPGTTPDSQQTTSTDRSRQLQTDEPAKAKSVHIQLPEPDTEVVRIPNNSDQGPSSDVRNSHQQPLSKPPPSVRNSTVQGVQPEAASTRSKRVINKPKRFIN